MKTSFIILCVLVLGLTGCAQQNNSYYVSDGYVASGYDVVSYFTDKPKLGKEEFIHAYDGVKFKFESQQNLNTFKENPQQYLPQYGGWCAYAIATNGSKVKIDPKTYEVRDGKLYLFYNFYFNNTLKSWLKEEPTQLIEKANKNWKALQQR
ncbi:MAG: YHS domain-containing (seleno)protein [Flammeovirgaceae bacterium]